MADSEKSLAIPKKKVGQPTKYRPSHCDVVEKAIAEGGTRYHAAALLNVSLQTILDWERAHPEFHAAVQRALAKAMIVWLDQRSLTMPPSSWVFAMKCLFGWRDQTEISGGGFTLIQNLGGKPGNDVIDAEFSRDDDAESENRSH